MSLQGYLILAVVIIALGMVIVMTMRNRGVGIEGRLVRAIWVWRIRHDKRFMAGVRRGLESYHRGDVKPWSEVKKDLGL